MATLLKDDAGIPIPQYQNSLGEFEPSKGAEGAFNVNDVQLATLIDRVETIQNRVATLAADVVSIKMDVASIESAMATIVRLLEAPLQDITRDVATIPEPTQSSGGGE